MKTKLSYEDLRYRQDSYSRSCSGLYLLKNSNSAYIKSIDTSFRLYSFDKKDCQFLSNKIEEIAEYFESRVEDIDRVLRSKFLGY